MTLSAFKSHFFQLLDGVHDRDELERFYYWLCEHFLALNRAEVVLSQLVEIQDETLLSLQQALDQLKEGAPIQYVVGHAFFMGYKFQVNEHVLIPRPETEELVSFITEEQANKSISILDIGTGSGCIAISLAKALPNAQVDALDISEEALKVAAQNADLLQAKVNFMHSDVLRLEQLPKIYDVIVSNPPYVTVSEKSQMHVNVLNFEPHTALFVDDDDPLVFYRVIAELAWKNLVSGGILYFEINQYLGKETQQLLENLGYVQVQLLKDVFQNDRMLVAQRP